MLSKILEQILVITSISPVFVALWFSEFISTGNFLDGVFWLVIFFTFIIISSIIIKFSKNNLEVLPIEIRSIAPAESL